MASPATASSPPQCPLCQHPNTRLYSNRHRKGDRWPIYRCEAPNCRHGFVHPRPTWDQVTAENADETARSEFATPDPATVARRPEIMRLMSIIRRHAPLPGRSLDVGSGDGTFSVALSLIGYTPHLIDLDPRGGLVTSKLPGATFATETFEALSDKGPYALILMSQVLEHAVDPLAWLQHAHSLLLPGGALVIALPNFGGIYRLLGHRDPYLIPPVHVNFFTPGSMRIALQQTGFRLALLDSDSNMGARRGDGRIGFKRAILSLSMRLAAPLLDPLARGIILHAIAIKP